MENPPALGVTGQVLGAVQVTAQSAEVAVDRRLVRNV